MTENVISIDEQPAENHNKIYTISTKYMATICMIGDILAILIEKESQLETSPNGGYMVNVTLSEDTFNELKKKMHAAFPGLKIILPGDLVLI